MAFFLDKDASREELTDAVNYLLSNFIESKNININSGEVSAQTTGISGYLYRYLSIKYADSWDGQVNFSNTPTNRLYYGIYNSDAIVEPTDYTKYLWIPVTGGLGTTKFVWYCVTGGRQVQILVDTAKPFANYFPDGGLAIDLDLLTIASLDDLSPSVDLIGTINNLIDQTQYGPQYQDFTGVYVPYRNATYTVDLNAQSLVNVNHIGVGPIATPNILVRVVGDNGSLSRIAIRGYSNDANGSAIRVTKFRATIAAPQAPQSGDSLGRFEFAGYATTSADGLAGAYLEGVTTEAWGATAHGTKVLWYVTPNTTTTPVVAITVDQDKKVTLSGAISVTGHTTFEGVTSTGATGTNKLVYDTSPVLVTPAIGIPSSGTLTSCTGLPIGGIVATGTPSSSTYLRGDSTWSTTPGGTVTSVAALTLGTTGTDLSSTVANGTTTPVITLQVPTASATNRGALSSTDWSTFNSKQPAGTYVTGVSVVSANGFAGTATSGATPAITLTTTITGLLKGNATAISAAVANTDYVGLSAPITKTADFTIGNGEMWFINNKAASTCTVTFPAASSWSGRQITIKNMQAFTVVSNASNIVPIDSVSAGTAILLAVIGNWATMVSDGTNWVIMQQAPNNILLLE